MNHYVLQIVSEHVVFGARIHVSVIAVLAVLLAPRYGISFLSKSAALCPGTEIALKGRCCEQIKGYVVKTTLTIQKLGIKSYG